MQRDQVVATQLQSCDDRLVAGFGSYTYVSPKRRPSGLSTSLGGADSGAASTAAAAAAATAPADAGEHGINVVGEGFDGDVDADGSDVEEVDAEYTQFFVFVRVLGLVCIVC